MESYLIGIDGGSTSIKTVLFDQCGKEIASASNPTMRLESHTPGFETFDVDRLWASTSASIKSMLAKAAVDPSRIAGIGMCSFGNGLIILDRDGKSIAPGVFSQDYRANTIVEGYKREGSFDRINDIIKGTLYAGEPGPILRWFKDQKPEVYEKIGGILLFKDYLMYRLTGVFATDANIFGGSAMLNLTTTDYSTELLNLYGIPEIEPFLPELATESSQIVGRVTEKAADETGLKPGTPVVAGMMDVLACLVGAGATADGIVTAVAGTWCINETHSTRIIPGASANMPYLTKGEYLNCAFTGASGSNYEWFCKAMGGEAKYIAEKQGGSYYEVLNELIASVPIETSKVMYLPFVAQPSVHPNAKAEFFNIDQNTTYAELAYALAEGVAFMHRYHIRFLRDSGCKADVVRLTGGIAKSQVWARIFADIIELPIETVDCNEVGALGCAITAGVGTGLYKSYEEAFEQAVKINLPVTSHSENFELYEKRYQNWSRLIEIMNIYWNEQ